MSIPTDGDSTAFGFDVYFKGLTKREYFALHCLQSILANGQKPDYEPAAIAAVGYADALIMALNARRLGGA